MAAEQSTVVVKLQPRISCRSRPSAYMEMPDEKTVMPAKVECVERARLLVEAHFQVLGYAARAAAPIKRHHKKPDENHRRNRAHPIEVGGHDAVLGAAARHADQFLGAEIGRQEGQAGDPDGHGMAGGQEVPAGGDFLAKAPADTEDESEIDDENCVINCSEFQR